jgi:hypothetical protein
LDWEIYLCVFGTGDGPVQLSEDLLVELHDVGQIPVHRGP